MSAFQEPIVNSTSGEYLVRAYQVEAIHGCIQPNNERASLIVTDFKFVSKQSSQRFVSATVSLSFKDLDSMGNISIRGNEGPQGPVVYNISPRGRVSIETKSNRPLELNSAATIPFESWTTNIKPLELNPITTAPVESWNIKGTSAGRIREGRSKYNDTARWDLLEDSTRKQGIPACFRTAIILKRKTDDPFLATIEIKVSVSTSSSFRTVLAGSSGPNITDNPIIFDPKKIKSSEELNGVDLYNLDKVDLRTHCVLDGTHIVFPDDLKGGRGSFDWQQDRSPRGSRAFETDSVMSYRS